MRHGESVANARGLLSGHGDLPLTDRGVEQATATASWLFDRFQLDRIVSSPLCRARQTAQALADAFELGVTEDDRFVEVSYGTLEGTPLAAVDPSLWARWIADENFKPEGGESLREVFDRVVPAVSELLSSGERVALVSHVSPIKAALCDVLGLSPLGAWRFRLSNASVSLIEKAPGDRWVITAMNVSPANAP